MEKREMLDALMVLGGFKTKRQFAKRLGVRENALGNWYGRNSFDIGAVAVAFPEVSPDWLLTGKGPMLRSEEADLRKEVEMLKERIALLEERMKE